MRRNHPSEVWGKVKAGRKNRMCKGPEAGRFICGTKGRPVGLESGEGGEEVIYVNVEKCYSGMRTK